MNEDDAKSRAELAVTVFREFMDRDMPGISRDEQLQGAIKAMSSVLFAESVADALKPKKEPWQQ